MASFNFPTLEEIVQRMQNDFQTELENSNPFLENSFMKALLTSLAGRFYENYIQLNFVFNSLFLNTATDDFLDAYGAIFAISREVATQSSGLVTVTGTPGTTINVGELLQSSNSVQYETQSDSAISAVVYSVTSLTRSGSVVTVITDNEHNYATGITQAISGADQLDYNVSAIITVIDPNTFTYTISTTPTTPATGTIISSADIASISVQSVDFGSDTDVSSGTELSFVSVIGGVDGGVAYVQTDGLTGGADQESDSAYRTRILDRYQDPVANFSSSDIEDQAFLINGVTRVWVQGTTPVAGQVTVYFVRDNDEVIIPTASEITEVKDAILIIKPESLDDVDVIVNAPTPVNVDFVFTFLDPNTSTMQDAIIANLQQYFSTQLGVDDDVIELSYNAVIKSTIDPTNGNSVATFTLSSPAGDVAISSNEIAILNSVTFT